MQEWKDLESKTKRASYIRKAMMLNLERDLELLCTRSYGLTVVSQLESDLKFRFDISNVANVKTSFKSLNSPFSHKIFIKSI